MALLARTGLRINVYGLCSMADFQFFKMTAVRHLGFAKVGNFNFRSGLEAHCASYAKFREDTLNRSGDIADFRFFKMAAVSHLGFWKFQIFNGWDAQEGRTASACQILSKSLKTRLRYGDFFIFSRWRPSAILDF